MINVFGPNFSPLANAISPFSTVGREAVGLENVEAKDDLLAPVEESPQEEKTLNEEDNNRDKEKVNERRGSGQGRDEQGLQEEELEQLRELEARDAEVRAHEQAHASVGGQYAGAPSFSYQTGPNGVKYAVGGEVPISLPSSSGNPEQTIRAAEQVRRAALAPVDPSGQDRRIAASASQVSQSARAEVRVQQTQERSLKAAEKAERAAEKRAEEQPGDKIEARKEFEKELILKQEQRKSVVDALRKANLLSESLSTSENVADSDAVGSFLDQTA